ncbi:DgyrCDS12929 [Dimorphilus gyrociliatus]|uniref:DgyrCDS12929 n=1 Tax=Dimorphilus gyrociliatus TaxID=2664684 RepID=A0A7I8W954_9ANNE|nr:DgyrCDS12929 [Dimorphilus gyrociliatus]
MTWTNIVLLLSYTLTLSHSLDLYISQIPYLTQTKLSTLDIFKDDLLRSHLRSSGKVILNKSTTLTNIDIKNKLLYWILDEHSSSINPCSENLIDEAYGIIFVLNKSSSTENDATKWESKCYIDRKIPFGIVELSSLDFIEKTPFVERISRIPTHEFSTANLALEHIEINYFNQNKTFPVDKVVKKNKFCIYSPENSAFYISAYNKWIDRITIDGNESFSADFGINMKDFKCQPRNKKVTCFNQNIGQDNITVFFSESYYLCQISIQTINLAYKSKLTTEGESVPFSMDNNLSMKLKEYLEISLTKEHLLELVALKISLNDIGKYNFSIHISRNMYYSCESPFTFEFKGNNSWMALPCYGLSKVARIHAKFDSMVLLYVLIYGRRLGPCHYEKLFIPYKIREKPKKDSILNVVKNKLSLIRNDSNVQNSYFLNDNNELTCHTLSGIWYSFFAADYNIIRIEIKSEPVQLVVMIVKLIGKDNNLSLNVNLNENYTLDDNFVANSIELSGKEEISVKICEIYIYGIFNSTIGIEPVEVKEKSKTCDYLEKLNDNFWLPPLQDYCYNLKRETQYIMYELDDYYTIQRIWLSHLNHSAIIDVSVIGSNYENYLNVQAMKPYNMRRFCAGKTTLSDYVTIINCVEDSFGDRLYIFSQFDRVLICEVKFIGVKIKVDSDEILLRVENIFESKGVIELDTFSNITSLAIQPSIDIQYYEVLGRQLDCRIEECTNDSQIVLFSYNSSKYGIQDKRMENLYTIYSPHLIKYVTIIKSSSPDSMTVKIFGRYQRGGNKTFSMKFLQFHLFFTLFNTDISRRILSDFQLPANALLRADIHSLKDCGQTCRNTANCRLYSWRNIDSECKFHDKPETSGTLRDIYTYRDLDNPNEMKKTIVFSQCYNEPTKSYC